MLDWPGNSPGLNLIENLWAIVKDKVADEHPISAKDLEMAIKRIWTKKITAKYCNHLVYSMLYCLQAVIKNKGGHINNRFLHDNWIMQLTFKLIFNVHQAKL